MSRSERSITLLVKIHAASTARREKKSSASFSDHVQKHLPKRLPFNIIFHRLKASSHMGEGRYVTRAEFENEFLVKNGHIKRITDPDIQSSVLEIMGTNVSTTFISTPPNPRETLGIKLPFLVMIIKNVCDIYASPYACMLVVEKVLFV